MNAIEIIIIIGAILLVAFTVIFNLIRKKKGKSFCACDCSSKAGGKCKGCSKYTDKQCLDKKETKES